MITLKALRYLNYRIFFVAAALLAVGLVFIFSATSQGSGITPFLYRQLLWAGFGLLLVWMIININFRVLGSLAYLFYGLSILVLVLVLTLGAVRKGAQGWFELGPITLQPAEMAKIGVIFILARYLSDRAPDRLKLRYVFIAMALAGVPMLLIMAQPDLGTALVLVPVFFGMLLTAGARIRHLAGIILLAAASMPVAWTFLQNYQRQRIIVFLNPSADPLGAGYNAIQSKIAVGSGGLFGKGWLQGTQSQLQFLPERHTDFIFSVLGEEWGFAGCALVLILYLVFILSGLRIAQESPDLFGKYLAAGLSLLIASHVIINTGMTIGIMPITGIPLPFLSYGGSHLVTVMVCLGFLENIHLNKTMY